MDIDDDVAYVNSEMNMPPAILASIGLGVGNGDGPYATMDGNDGNAGAGGNMAVTGDDIDANEEVFFDDDIDDAEANGDENDVDHWSRAPKNKRKETEEEAVELNRVVTKVYDEMQDYLESIPEAAQPTQLITPLMPHQLQALHWLTAQEDKGNIRCGILADDMGVGKTIETLALLCARKRPYTLIICPLTMLQHWKAEIERHISPGTFTVASYYGSMRPKSLDDLLLANIVLTTYGTLSAEYKKLGKIGYTDASLQTGAVLDNPLVDISIHKCLLYAVPWARVILDEAQYVKNRGSVSHKAAAALSGAYRFTLTGTPISNSLDDLYALLSFIRFPDYPDYREWRNSISKPIAEHKSLGYKRLSELLKRSMLRRRKDQMLKGKPIVELPPVTANAIYLDFSEDDKLFYFATEQRIMDQFEALARRGQAYVMKHYTHVLVLLLRLRQAACHPYLVSMANIYSTEDANMIAQGQGVWNFDELEKFTQALIQRLKDTRQDIIEQQKEQGKAEITELEVMKQLTRTVAMNFVSNTEGAPCLKCHRAAEDPILTPCRHLFCRACIPEAGLVVCPKCEFRFNNLLGQAVAPATPGEIHLAAEFAKNPVGKVDPSLLVDVKTEKKRGNKNSAAKRRANLVSAEMTKVKSESSFGTIGFGMGSAQRPLPRIVDTITLDDDDDDDNGQIMRELLRRSTSPNDPIVLDEDDDVLKPLVFPRSASSPFASNPPMTSAEPRSAMVSFSSFTPSAPQAPIVKPDPLLAVQPNEPAHVSPATSNLLQTRLTANSPFVLGSPGLTQTPVIEPISAATPLPSVPSRDTMITPPLDATMLSKESTPKTSPPNGAESQTEAPSTIAERRPRRQTRLSPILRNVPESSTKVMVMSRARLNEPSMFKPMVGGVTPPSPAPTSSSPTVAVKLENNGAAEQTQQDDENEAFYTPPSSSTPEPPQLPASNGKVAVKSESSTEKPKEAEEEEDDKNVEERPSTPLNIPNSRSSSGFFQEGVTDLDSPPKPQKPYVTRVPIQRSAKLSATSKVTKSIMGDYEYDLGSSDSERSEDDEDDRGSDLGNFIVNDEIDDGDQGYAEDNESPRHNGKRTYDSLGDDIESEYLASDEPENGKKKRGRPKKRKVKEEEAEEEVRPEALVDNFGLLGPRVAYEVHVPTNLLLKGAAAKKALARYELKRHSTKLTALLSALELVKSAGSNDKIVIYSQFTRYLDVIEAPLKHWGWKMLRLDGRMSQVARANTLKAFDEDPEARILIISLKAGGVGINLTVANHIFLMDPWWNTSVEKQAIDRVHRIGQKKPIFVTRFFVNQTVEQRILSIQEEKDKIANRALSNHRGDIAPRRGLTFNELRQLFTSSLKSTENNIEPLISRDGPDTVNFNPRRPVPDQNGGHFTTPEQRTVSPQPIRSSGPVQTTPLDPFRPL